MFLISINEFYKFPQDIYEDEDLIGEAPFRRVNLAQDIYKNIVCCDIEGDLEAFRNSDIEYEEVDEIPTNFNQICLPQEAGRYLTYAEIKAWKPLKEINLENIERDNYLLDNDYRISLIELGVTEDDL